LDLGCVLDQLLTSLTITLAATANAALAARITNTKTPALIRRFSADGITSSNRATSFRRRWGGDGSVFTIKAPLTTDRTIERITDGRSDDDHKIVLSVTHRYVHETATEFSLVGQAWLTGQCVPTPTRAVLLLGANDLFL
jgi:hypothetical protein